jgi:hypothetical protein
VRSMGDMRLTLEGAFESSGGALPEPVVAPRRPVIGAASVALLVGGMAAALGDLGGDPTGTAAGPKSDALHDDAA